MSRRPPVDGEWFAVLPDADAGRAAARALRPRASEVVAHGSGRPWLMGHWPGGELTTAGVGEARVAVAGACPATVASLRESLRGVRSVEDAGRTVAGLPGCFHLAASVGGRVRVQGTLASVRRVFHARVGDAVIAADSAQVLAWLTGADWDRSWLALRLSAPETPFPLHESTPWQGVRAVPGDHWLALDRDGTATERRRWTPPEPVVPLAEGADTVRRTLAAAVRTRTAQGGTVSTDLSGGMDSTGLAFLAARSPVHLVTYRWAEHDEGNDDAWYARQAAARLTQARHRVDAVDDMVAMFADLTPDAPPADPEEPFAWVRTRGRLAHIARTMAAEGSRIHLGGHGGDELFRPGYGYLHDLVRARPFTGLRHARASRALTRWPLTALLRALSDRRTPGRELAGHAEALDGPWPGPRDVTFGWCPAPRLPGWVTDDTLAAARDLLHATAREPVAPLAPLRAQHHVLLAARTGGCLARQADRLCAAHGTGLAVPYLDDQVLDAALSVRLEERNSPWRYKPLLATALRGTVPDVLLDRTTKGEFGADVHLGLRRHRADLLHLFDRPELARYGLIDAAAVHRALLRPHTDAATVAALDATLACEMWLRALKARAAAGPPPGSGATPAPPPSAPAGSSRPPTPPTPPTSPGPSAPHREATGPP